MKIFILFLLAALAEASIKPIFSNLMYAKIRNETGVSLHQAFMAITTNDSVAVRNLNFYARKIKSEGVEKRIRDQISITTNRCQKEKNLTCTESIEQLNGALIKIQEMEKNYKKLSPEDKIQYAVTIYADQIHSKIFNDFWKNWEQSCLTEKDKSKIQVCQKSLAEVQELEQISASLTQLIATKTIGSQIETANLNFLKRRIEKYEKN